MKTIFTDSIFFLITSTKLYLVPLFENIKTLPIKINSPPVLKYFIP